MPRTEPILVVLAVKQRRSPLSLLAGVRTFFEEFEERGPRTVSGLGREGGRYAF